MNFSRRKALVTGMAGCAGLIAYTGQVSAQAAALAETDPQAVALGFNADSTKVDKAKYPQHQASQMCSGCNFFQGKPTDAMAPCQLFAGKQVPGKGWCTAWAKKAA